MSSDTDLVPTRYSKLKKVASDSVQVIKHESRKVTRNDVGKVNKWKSENIKVEDTFDIQKAKHEVIRFGISGFDYKKKEDATKALLIRLGAKPPKKKCVNYKLLQQQRKAEKEVMKKEMDLLKLRKYKLEPIVIKSNRKRVKKSKETVNVLDVYGKVDANKLKK